MSNDYELRTTDPWAYALDADPDFLPASLIPTVHGYNPGTAPFNHSGWPVTIRARLRPIPKWRPDERFKESAAPPPKSPACAAAPLESATAAGAIAGTAATALAPAAASAATQVAADGSPPTPTAFDPASQGAATAADLARRGSAGNSGHTGGDTGSAGDCGPVELHDLVPYGGTELRIGEMPLAFHT